MKSWERDGIRILQVVIASLNLQLNSVSLVLSPAVELYHASHLWYLADYCVPVSTVPGRQHLRFASRRQLIVPRVRRSTFGARAFAIAGPTVWNSLPDSLRDPAVGPDQFRRDLKTHLFE